MILILTTFAVSVGSALLPLINIELYLAGVGAVGAGAALTLALSAAAGQTVGKIVWYEVARRGVDSEWAQKKMSSEKVRASYDRWVGRMEGRPAYAGLIMFLSSFSGVPPLLVMAAVAGALKMPMWLFVPTVFIGRTLRFWLILEGIEFLAG